MNKLLSTLTIILITVAVKAQPSVSLWNIQYSNVDSCGALPNSPYNNTYVKTGGIVTAAYGYGYYVQTSYAHKWAAINVYDGSHTPAVGDSIQLTGQVIEYYNETELDSIKSFTVVSTGNQARTPVTYVAFDSIQRREYQAMLVKVKNATCLRYNSAQVWWVFYDSTMTGSMNSEDTIDNIIMTTQVYTPGDKYNITGVVHLEYANWIEPRNAADIEGVQSIQNPIANANIFPNPNCGLFTASIDATTNMQNMPITLFDLTGRAIYRQVTDIRAGNNTVAFNFGTLEKGVYFLQLGNSQAGTVKKIVIE